MNERSVTLLRTLAADPSASINAAMGGWKETLAAYRFFDNSNVERGEIIKPHREATQQRIDNEEVVLVVQDTTELKTRPNWTSQATPPPTAVC